MSSSHHDEASKRAENLSQALDAISPESREQMNAFVEARLHALQEKHGTAFCSAAAALFSVMASEDTLNRLGFLLPFRSDEIVAHLVRLSSLSTDEWILAIDEVRDLMGSAVLFVDDTEVLTKVPPRSD